MLLAYRSIPCVEAGARTSNPLANDTTPDTMSTTDELERSEWVARLNFASFGARIGIRANDPTLLDGLERYLPPKRTLARHDRLDSQYSLILNELNVGSLSSSRYVLYREAERLLRTDELDRAHAALEADLHFQIAVAARRKLFVHAGVVAWRGRSIVIPGRSGSGKTSLVVALVQAGADYYSDEYAVFDPRGRVHPYARPLMLRSPGRPPRRCPAEELRGPAGTKPLPLGLVVMTNYRPGARWRPRENSPAQAMMALFDNTVLARVRPRFALSVLKKAVTGTATLKGTRGEAADVGESLLSYCSWSAPRKFAAEADGVRRQDA